jgi:predicted nucleotidyltransferase component of viral defense system
MLKQLFSIEAPSGRLLFKGGTSLSKIFHAINRSVADLLRGDYRQSEYGMVIFEGTDKN